MGRKPSRHFYADPVDLIITDNAMPRMTGSEMVRILRSSGAPVKILGIIGLNLDTEMEARLDGSLHKPFARETFLEAVRALLPLGTRTPDRPATS